MFPSFATAPTTPTTPETRVDFSSWKNDEKHADGFDHCPDARVEAVIMPNVLRTFQHCENTGSKLGKELME